MFTYVTCASIDDIVLYNMFLKGFQTKVVKKWLV